MKKVILSVIILITIVSCKPKSTEERLKEFATKYETDRFKNDGENVESISLDSFKYDEADMQYYWVNKNVFFYDIEKEHLSICKELRALHTQMILNNTSMGKHINEDSVKNVFKKDNEPFIKSELEHKFIDSMSKIADTAKTLYRLEYILKAKTNKQSYNGSTSYAHFFRKSDMTEVLDTVKIKL